MNLTLQSEVVIAYLAVIGKKPGALDLADGVEKQLYGAVSNWSYVDSAIYKSKTPEQRLAWWASDEPLKLKFNATSSGWWGPQISGGVLDTALIDGIKSAYEAVFGAVDQVGADFLANLKKNQLPAPPPPPAPTSRGGSGLALVGGLAALAVVVGVVVVASKSRKKGKR